MGVIADILWHEIPNHANNVELDAFVVMPNHIHGIIILNEHDQNNSNPNQNQPPTRFQNIGKNSISSIIGSYKSAVTKHANRLGYDFAWQARFHDHIIRNDAEYQRIRNYIESNIINWPEDKFYNIEAL